MLAATDVQFGSSQLNTLGKYEFVTEGETAKNINGVRVTGRRTTASVPGAIPMLLYGISDQGTFPPVKTAVVTHIDRDICLVLDRSGSMTSRTPGSNCWKDLKKAVKGFLVTLKTTAQGERGGALTYSSLATLDENMKLNYGQLMSTINGKAAAGATAIGLGLEDGITGITNPAYARSIAAKTIGLMTDGIHNTGINPDIVVVDARAKKHRSAYDYI